MEGLATNYAIPDVIWVSPLLDPRWIPVPLPGTSPIENDTSIAESISTGIDHLRRKLMYSDDALPRMRYHHPRLFPNDRRKVEKDPHKPVARYYESIAASCQSKWEGNIPKAFACDSCPDCTTYSRKVFLGGVSFDISNEELFRVFHKYGPIQVVRPEKEPSTSLSSFKGGYLYIILENEDNVNLLLNDCTLKDDNSWQFRIFSKGRNVEVIPWLHFNRDYYTADCPDPAPQNTVFVGGLHGTMTADAVAHVMGSLFGEVAYAGIDVDKYQYPIGSGRVTFSSHKSYVKAIAKAFVEIKTPKFTKRVQVDPYIDTSAMCSNCGAKNGPVFCRDMNCLKHYCHECWRFQHLVEGYRHHVPTMRTNTQ